MSKPEEPTHDPFDIAAEQSLIGSLLVDNRLIEIVVATLDQHHFYEGLHGRIFEALRVSIIDNGKTVTPLTLNAMMKSDPGLIELGGHAYLAGLAEASPTKPDVRHLAEIIADHAVRRQMVVAGEDLARDAVRSPILMPTAVLLARAQQDIEVAVDDFRKINGRQEAHTGYAIAMRRLEEAQAVANGKPVPVIRTGLEKLNAEIGGFMAPDLILIPGRPGWGKSALKGSLSLRSAMAGHPTLVFSLEMGEGQWMDRNICELDYDDLEPGRAPLVYGAMKESRFTPDMFSRYGAAAQRLHSLPLEIDEQGDVSMIDIANRSRAFAARYPGQLGMIVIDYAQKVRPSGRADNREQEVNQIAAGAKTLAKRLGWPVVMGAQLSREVDKRPEENRRPMLSDLRESGGLEQEADLILCPYRRASYVLQRRPGPGATKLDWDDWNREYEKYEHVMEITCPKNRHGRVFDITAWVDMGSNVIRAPLDD